MSPKRTRLLLAAVLLGVFAFVCYWLSPGTRLTPNDIDRYLERMDAGLSMEQGEKHEFLKRLRRWAMEDDGRPVHMLNLIRFHDVMPPVPGHPEFSGTAEEANAYYETMVLPLLAERGVYPVFASAPQGLETARGRMSNLIGFERELDGWDRVMLVRYPNRRAFLDMASDSTYMEAAPFKLAAIDLGFIPLHKNYQVPDPRWMTAMLAILLYLVVTGVRIRKP